MRRNYLILDLLLTLQKKSLPTKMKISIHIELISLFISFHFFFFVSSSAQEKKPAKLVYHDRNFYPLETWVRFDYTPHISVSISVCC